MTNDDPTDAARAVLERVRTKPETEDVAELWGYLDAEDVTARKDAVKGLRVTASRTPSILPEVLDDDLASLRARADDPNASVRATAADLLGTAWRLVESPPTGAVVDALGPLLDDDTALVRTNALQSLRTIGGDEPEELVPVASGAVPALDAHGASLEHGVAVVAIAATADGSSVADAVPRLVELLEGETGFAGANAPRELRTDDGHGLQERIRDVVDTHRDSHRFVRQTAGHAVVEVAVDEPGAVVPVASELGDLLSDPDPQVRHVVADVFVALGDGRADAVADHAGALGARLADDEAAFVLTSVVRALAAAGASDPDHVREVVVERVDELVPLLDDEEPSVRGGAASLLALVAEADPAAVEPAADTLRTLADDDVDFVAAPARDALDSLE